MAIATNLGFPRMGRNRELKKSLEQFWAGTISAEQLQATAAQPPQDQRRTGPASVLCFGV